MEVLIETWLVKEAPDLYQIWTGLLSTSIRSFFSSRATSRSEDLTSKGLSQITCQAP